MRFVPKYLEALGGAVFVIGAYDALKTVLGAVYAYPGGIAVDRWGHRTAFILFTLVSIAGYAILLFTESWMAVLAATFLFLGWTTLSLPATFTLVARTLSADKHAMGIGIQSLIRRVPVVVGPIVGGLLIDHYGMRGGVRIGVAVSIFLALASMGLQWRLESLPRGASTLVHGLRHVLKSTDARFHRLLFSDILIRFCERIPFAWVVIYAMDVVHVSATNVGVLIAVEMTAAMICYVPAAYLADRYGKEPFVIATFIFFTLFPLVLGLSHGFVMLVVAFAVRGLKEFGEPARKALILAYAPDHAKGRAVGAYYLIRDLVVSVGAFAGAALWKVSPEVNFASASAVGLLGTAFYVWSMRRDAMTRAIIGRGKG